jgi:hypothetical protein
MSEQERHFYDKYAKHCLGALPNFLYDRLGMGMAAKVGTDRSAELADVYGIGKRVCDALHDLKGITSSIGKPVPARRVFKSKSLRDRAATKTFAPAATTAESSKPNDICISCNCTCF